MDEIDLPAITRRHLERERQIRTRIIVNVIEIERHIEGSIATFFCREEYKHVLFTELLFQTGQIPLSRKTEILRKILEYNYPELSKRYHSILARVDSIRGIRNKLAHAESFFPLTEEDEIDGIKIRVIKGGEIKEEALTTKDIDEKGNIAAIVGLSLFYLASAIEAFITEDDDAEAHTERIDRLISMYPDILQSHSDTGKAKPKKQRVSNFKPANKKEN